MNTYQEYEDILLALSRLQREVMEKIRRRT